MKNDPMEWARLSQLLSSPAKSGLVVITFAQRKSRITGEKLRNADTNKQQPPPTARISQVASTEQEGIVTRQNWKTGQKARFSKRGGQLDSYISRRVFSSF